MRWALPAMICVVGALAWLALHDLQWARRFGLVDPHTMTPLPGQPLMFKRPCAAPTAAHAKNAQPNDALAGDAQLGDTRPVVLGFMGDALLHNGPWRQAQKRGFPSLFQAMVPWWQAPDLTYANLEGTFGAKTSTKRTSSRNRLRYEPAFAAALADAGFDVVSTANNHANDRGANGIVTTLDVLEASGISAVGTRRSLQNDDGFSLITTVRGMTIGWVACTEWNNIDTDKGRVLQCERDRDAVIARVTALAQQVDAVVVTPHGGTEFSARPNLVTQQFAQDVVDAGALLVIGNHPHVLQPWQVLRGKDGHEALYSSCSGAGFTRLKAPGKRKHKKPDARVGAYLLAALARGEDGRVHLQSARYLPYHWLRDADGFRMEPAADNNAGRSARTRIHKLLAPDNEQRTDAPLASDPLCR